VSKLGLKVQDYLEVRLEGGKIVLEPQVIVPKDQAYFYTKEWQKEERQAAEDIRRGRVTKTRNVRGLIEKLDR
jgi:hypothetical protein